MRIHELEGELEPTWCCNLGLVPVTNLLMALILCLLNIASPGLGTFCSMFFGSNADPVPAVDIRAEGNEDFEEEY